MACGIVNPFSKVLANVFITKLEGEIKETATLPLYCRYMDDTVFLRPDKLQFWVRKHSNFFVNQFQNTSKIGKYSDRFEFADSSLSPLPPDKSNTNQLKSVLRILLSPYVALS